ncbi:MAG TPA: VTT domain-containing protein [Actinopolymorphaceae bacterium]|jgi:membrane protein DedA with SNARE-associated domain
MPTDDWPFAASVAVLFVIVLLRANATYWAGRGLRAGADRSWLARHLDRRAFVRAQEAVHRWGAPAVTVSFLTVGFQTAVNAAAGALQMPLRRYLPAVVIGSLVWAFLYATVGFAVIDAWLGADGRRWIAGAVAVVVAGVVIWRVLVSRRRRPVADVSGR